MNPLRICSDQHLLLNGKIEYIINGKRAVSGTFSVGDKVSINVYLPRILGTTNATLIVTADSDSVSRSITGLWSGIELDLDIYSFSLNESSLGVGLYFFTVRVECIGKDLYALPSYDEVRFTENAPREGFQITVSDFKGPDNPYHLGGVIYQIFVDRFNSSKKYTPKNGAVLAKDWDIIPEFPSYPGAPMKNNTFYGGDLSGITEKLPYIASLGVNIIYLSPIFEAKSNHKYDTADYMSVDSMFGGEKALKTLICEAKKLGIKIILDGVFNHTGDDSIYFNRYGTYDSLGAYQSTQSPYYHWYEFKNHPSSYTAWWGIEILPRINPDIPACRDFFTGKGGVIEKYAKMGIGGFRLDVVDELSDDFTCDIKRVLLKNNPEALLYGEVWEDPSNKIAYGKRKRYYQGDELDGAMNYPLRRGIIDYLKSERTDTLRYALTTVLNNAPERIRNTMMNILGSHDTERILTVLGGESSYDKSNEYLSKARMSSAEREVGITLVKTAYTILATLPGLPTIFYGDEAGLEGYSDPFNRMPYPWESENIELIEHYKALGRIRSSHRAYRNGDFTLHRLDDEILVFSRGSKEASYITIVNNSNSKTISIDGDDYKILLGNGNNIYPHMASIIKTKSSNIKLITY